MKLRTLLWSSVAVAAVGIVGYAFAVAPWLARPAEDAASIERRFDRAAPVLTDAGDDERCTAFDRGFGTDFRTILDARPPGSPLIIPLQTLPPAQQRAILVLEQWWRDGGAVPPYACEHMHQDLQGSGDDETAPIAWVALGAWMTVDDPASPRALAVIHAARELLTRGGAPDALAGAALLSTVTLSAQAQGWTFPASVGDLRPDPDALRHALARDARCEIDSFARLSFHWKLGGPWAEAPGLRILAPGRESAWRMQQWADILGDAPWTDLAAVERRCDAAVAAAPAELFLAPLSACEQIRAMRQWRGELPRSQSFGSPWLETLDHFMPQPSAS